MHDNDYPNEPGFKHGSPDTARLAASSMTRAAANRSALALNFLDCRAAFGATADEVAKALDWERYSSRPRLAELHKRGAIVDSGQRREGVSGRGQAVWVLPEYGPAKPADPQGDLLAAA